MAGPDRLGFARCRARRGEIQEPDELAHQRLVSDRHCASSHWPRQELAVSEVVDRAGLDARGISDRNIDTTRRYEDPSFFIEPPVLAVKEEVNRRLPKNDPKRTLFQHPIGVERITEIRIVKPKAYQPIAAFTYLEKAGIFKVSEGPE